MNRPSATPTSARLLAPVLAAAALHAASVAQAGEVHLLGLVPYSYAVEPSADGSVVVGYDGVGAWWWTKDTWVIRIENSLPYGNGVGGQPSITADGNVIVCATLEGKPPKAEATFYDRMSGEYSSTIGSLGFHCDISRTSAWGMTPTASHVCGLVWDSACAAKGFIWDAKTDTMRLLPTVYFYKPTRGNDVSDDGSLVGGWNDDYVGYRQGCVWKRNANGDYVATLLNTGVATQKLREVSCVSGNGVWAYGEGRPDVASGAPYRWSFATGFQPIGPMPTAGVGRVYKANFDGSKLLGGINGTAYLWFAERGYVSLADWALENGVTLTEGWNFTGFGMTEDALTITGFAVRASDGGWSPFVLDLRPSSPACPADLDGDLEVAATDLAQLLAMWGSFGGDADLNGDGAVDALDLSTLLAAWGPCP